MELTELQLFVLGAIASIIVWGVKQAKQDVHAGWLTGGVYVVALGLAYFFAPLALPAAPVCDGVPTCVTNVVEWLQAALVPVSAFVGAATVLYNALMKRILDQAGAKAKSFFISKKK